MILLTPYFSLILCLFSMAQLWLVKESPAFHLIWHFCLDVGLILFCSIIFLIIWFLFSKTESIRRWKGSITAKIILEAIYVPCLSGSVLWDPNSSLSPILDISCMCDLGRKKIISKDRFTISQFPYSWGITGSYRQLSKFCMELSHVIPFCFTDVFLQNRWIQKDG